MFSWALSIILGRKAHTWCEIIRKHESASLELHLIHNDLKSNFLNIIPCQIKKKVQIRSLQILYQPNIQQCAFPHEDV